MVSGIGIGIRGLGACLVCMGSGRSSSRLSSRLAVCAVLCLLFSNSYMPRVVFIWLRDLSQARDSALLVDDPRQTALVPCNCLALSCLVGVPVFVFMLC